ncbi:hypothetical protein IE81DRAFT_218539 [Ceraceosorus guamensis]|uniref:SUN domain-containing protein n=1 Tax=Ceraceosorus guamensis TaxID=1522189 RepID=A0A316VUH2_9BASI|nr:hypothetical protein IE81DRAFT_218539 [Ceraceosorus guamensis]PWN40538.1 hypothetical protein IE81DRAFT_218539 [Ceraceosorus guamensis]
MQGHSKGSASRSSHIWFGGGRHTRHPHATSFAQTLADHCSDPAESSALHDKKLLTPRCRASQLLRPLINLATPATKSAGSSLRYAALPRAIFTLAVLLLCALPVRALFDPGEPINSTSAGNFKVSASKGATPVNALAPMRHQVGVPPGCRRTTSLFNDICPAPSIDTSPATAALRSELILCPLPNVEPLAPAKDGKEPQEGPNSRETVWAVSGTITLPAGDDPEGLAGGQSGLDQGPKPSLARIAAPDAEGVSRDEAHAEEFMPEEGAEGYWRHVGGSAVWVPASQSTARRDPTATPQAPRSDVWPTDTMSRSASSSLDATAGSEQQAYSDWSKSVGGEGSDTWLSFAAWRKAHEEAAAKEREDARKAAKTAKSRTTSALPAQDPPGTQRTTTNASHASTLATSATSAIPSAGTVSRNPRADSQAQKAEVHDEYRAQPMNRTTEHAPFDGSPAAMPTFSGILPRPSSPDGGALPAVGNPAAQLATLKHRWNFASLDCAAVVHRSNPSAKFASSILSDKKDRYMLSPCPGVKRQDQPAASAKGESQFVIVELCDEISIDTIVMANFEFFSRMFKRFRVRVARKLYDRDEDWVDIGSFRARNVRGLQVFNTVQPRSEARFFRYLRIDFLEHYGSEFYCPVSLLRVYGLTQMDDYIREEEEMRREKEREDAGIFADADVEQEEQETSQIASSEDEASQLPSWRGGANFEPEVVAKHPAFTPSTRETTIAGRPDTSAAAGGTSESKSSQPGTTSPMHLSNSLVAPQSTPRKESSDPLETLNLSPHFHEDASSPNMTIASGNGEHNLTASGNVSSESSAEAEAIASLPSHTRIGDRDVTEVAQKAASTEQSRLFSSTAMAASETASDKHAVPVEASQQRSQAETVSIASGLSNVSSLPATSTEAEICSTSSDDASATSTPPNAAAASRR